MSDTTLILLGAGSATRFNAPVKKQWLYIDDTPLWLYVAEHFETSAMFKDIIIVSSVEEIDSMRSFAPYSYVTGGSTRQASLTKALQQVDTPYVLVSDIARCCVPTDMIKRILDAKEGKGVACVVPALLATDTLYLNTQPIDREGVRIIQTPQLSLTSLLKKALNTQTLFTDDSSAIASLGEEVIFVEGDSKAVKLTTIEDLEKLSCLAAPSQKTLTGFGIDTHPFTTEKKMFLCGVEIDCDFGFKAHSDGDVAIHALIDALLGASGMGDIGMLYPDTEKCYEGVDSSILLRDTVKRLQHMGYTIGNVDISIVAQKPTISPYKDKMRHTLALLLGIRANFINIKATTSEKLGFIGREEGVTVHAVANLNYCNWKNLINGNHI